MGLVAPKVDEDFEDMVTKDLEVFLIQIEAYIEQEAYTGQMVKFPVAKIDKSALIWSREHHEKLPGAYGNTPRPGKLRPSNPTNHRKRYVS